MNYLHLNDKIKKPATFIHIPKNGGNSIYKWLLQYGNVEVGHGGRREKLKLGVPKHATFTEAKNIIAEKHPKLDMGVTFAVARNPYSRIVSSYLYGIKRKHLEQCTFEEYIVEKIHDNWYTQLIFTPQVEFVRGLQIVLKLENIEQDLKKISQAIGAQKHFDNLGTYNSTPTYDYREYYDNDTQIEIVTEMYKEDIKQFGYSF